jgi:hypothetical protein
MKKFYQLTREKREYLAMRESVRITSDVPHMSSETYAEFNTGLKALTGIAVCKHS